MLFLPPDQRQYPAPGPGQTGLTEVNFLLFAIACRWIATLEYVYGPGGGSDEIAAVMRNFDLGSDAIQLAAMSSQGFRNAQPSQFRHNVAIKHLEPEVPYQHGPREDFFADARFDFVCLTRSPQYTPSTADPLYDEIASKFIAAI